MAGVFVALFSLKDGQRDWQQVESVRAGIAEKSVVAAQQRLATERPQTRSSPIPTDLEQTLLKRIKESYVSLFYVLTELTFDTMDFVRCLNFELVLTWLTKKLLNES